MTSRRSDVDFTGLLTSRGNNPTRLRAAPQTRFTDHDVPVRFRPGGYSEDMFTELADDEKRKYECNICFLIVKDPRQCTNSHLFCATCIFTWTLSPSGDNRDKCPVCRSPGRYRPDMKVESRLNRKRVVCPEESCPWKGTLLTYKKNHKHMHDVEGTATIEPQLPPIITTSMNQGYAELERTGGDSGEFLWRLVAEPTSTTSRPAQLSQTYDMRTGRGRRHLEHLFQNFSSQLELRRRSIEEAYQTRETQRRIQVQEVDNLGRRLDEVSTELNRLVSDMSRDNDRYQGYIQTSRDMEDSLMNLTHGFPETVHNHIAGNVTQEPDNPTNNPCSNSGREQSSRLILGNRLHSMEDLSRNVSISTPPSPGLSNQPRSYHVDLQFRSHTLPQHRTSPRRPPTDVGPAINTNLAVSRAATRRISDSPRHSIGASPGISLPRVEQHNVTARREILANIASRSLQPQSLSVDVASSDSSMRHRRRRHDTRQTLPYNEDSGS